MTNIFSQRKQRLFQLKAKREQGAHKLLIEKELKECPMCKKQHDESVIAAANMTCPSCGHHFPMGAYHRLSMLIDHNTFKELNLNLVGTDPLQFPDYNQKCKDLRKQTALNEAVVTAQGKINGHSAVIAVLDSRFLMGSMGAVMGEKITLAIAHAQKNKLPLIIFTASGGARMQEGIISLMQMAKTSAAIKQFSDAGGLYIVCYTNPTMGGVSASFAALADITLAEPNALIGFAGQRVIEQTIGQTLPQGFQRAEFQRENGFVDKIVERKELKRTLEQLLMLHKARRRT